MAGVIFTLGLMAAFVVALRIFWLRAEQPQGETKRHADDSPSEQEPTKMPWGARRQRRYINEGLHDLEEWVHNNTRRPDAGT